DQFAERRLFGQFLVVMHGVAVTCHFRECMDVFHSGDPAALGRLMQGGLAVRDVRPTILFVRFRHIQRPRVGFVVVKNGSMREAVRMGLKTTSSPTQSACCSSMMWLSIVGPSSSWTRPT